MKISALGDSAMIIDFADEPQQPETLLQHALSAAAALERANIPGVIEITSAYSSVALFIDLARIEAPSGETISSFLAAKISTVLSAGGRRSRLRQRIVEIPVCYDGQFGLDVERVAMETGMSVDDIIHLHSSARFTVACLGFMPGFPYLAGLPEELRVPRLTTPRTSVPAGSVAIANMQAGIYPFSSPGGWNILGRTPLTLFNAYATPPALLAPGDLVHFRRITLQEFESMTAAPNTKSHR